VAPGSVFFCLTGLGEDRHIFIPDAVARGASALVVEREDVLRTLPSGPTVVWVPDARRALAHAAAVFYGHPSRALTLIGVTGTNGKTTTTYFLASVLGLAGHRVLRVGTIGASFDGEERPTPATTPEASDLQALLAEARAQGLDTALIEVSSHALVLQRVRGCHFDAVVLTNITQDHLDFHGTMEAYVAAKRRLFEPEPQGYAGPETRRILNLDDERGREWARQDWPHLWTYGFAPEAEVRAVQVHLTPQGSRFRVVERGEDRGEIHLNLLGRYNVVNALAAAATARARGYDWEVIREGLQAVRRVPGRLERIEEGQPFSVLVDYAHTPDALQRVLRTVREVTPRRVIVVFGCGGDRDRKKRPLMGRIGAEESDVCILTSDNPRTEDPKRIVDDIEAGLPPHPRARVYREVDRERAIALALELAQPGDTVLIAGKGHETVQIIGRERRPFDDREVVRRRLRLRGGGG
jgi:UDP-N-acetylmuramoyl-L-alanyl-D-glutamate--2,6-diaminopimelate ligase